MVQRIDQRLQCLLALLGLELAFPNSNYIPTHLMQLLLLQPVPLTVPLDFLCPEKGVGLWHDKITAALMTVPKAAVYKNTGSIFAENDIRFPGKTGNVESIAEAIVEKVVADKQFRLCAFAVNPAHAKMALQGC